MHNIDNTQIWTHAASAVRLSAIFAMWSATLAYRVSICVSQDAARPTKDDYTR